MQTPYSLGIAKGTYIYPPEGLDPQSHYLVEVASGSGNPIHRAILYTSFLDKNGNPKGGHIYNPTYEPCCLPEEHFYYVKVLRKLLGKELNEA